MYGKILALVILIVTIVPITYTMFVWIRKTYAKFHNYLSKTNEWKSNVKGNFKINKKMIRSLFLKLSLPKILLIKNGRVLFILICLFTVSFMGLFVDTPIQNKIPVFINLVMILIVFIGIGKYFLHTTSNIAINYQNWFMCVLILVIYILSFLLSYIENPENLPFLMVLIVFSIVFAVLLVLNVLSNFNNVFFQLLNFVFLFVVILSVVGMGFGLFYLWNNEIFNLYTTEEYNKIMFHFDSGVSSYLFIMYKGLIPFYTYTNSGITLETPITLILIGEYLIGFLFNVVIIGFFLSYFVSKLLKNKEIVLDTE
ncbi:hypothetical protein [Robertmurraya massiliosenegalensis]|uniref:hypothetical protein n=1 Tax=Robertmurraya massiliosenegalensis TaxID=1287657 RepID=UPI0002FCB609|nr:hypothetical protein [Robertmurraya massiliosenegalensis]